MGHGNETGIIPRFCEELFSRADVARDLNKVPVFIPMIWIYTDRQKKRYNRILSGYTCGSQTRAAQAYHDQNIELSIGVIWIYRFLFIRHVG